MYTVWVDNYIGEPELIFTAPTFRAKAQVFEYAKSLLTLPAYYQCRILVRKVFIRDGVVDENCIEWEFTDEDL